MTATRATTRVAAVRFDPAAWVAACAASVRSSRARCDAEREGRPLPPHVGAPLVPTSPEELSALRDHLMTMAADGKRFPWPVFSALIVPLEDAAWRAPAVAAAREHQAALQSEVDELRSSATRWQARAEAFREEITALRSEISSLLRARAVERAAHATSEPGPRTMSRRRAEALLNHLAAGGEEGDVARLRLLEALVKP